MRVAITIDPGLTRALTSLRKPALHATFRDALTHAAYEVQRIAAQEKIRRGGVVGKGRQRMILPPLPDRLTSRTGSLRRSIGVDRSDLPFAISIGTELVYGRVHETGGRFGRAKYPPRPFLSPALDDVMPKFESFFARAIQRAAGVA